ncbi:MAG: hypothetical protein C4547_06490 [Phycisphaerales bacterium]|nr:MAG: hypothetical protein C4547_06490 [Phycisphaerales bacterium]
MRSVQPSNFQPSNLQPANLQPANLPTFNLQPSPAIATLKINTAPLTRASGSPPPARATGRPREYTPAAHPRGGRATVRRRAPPRWPAAWSHRAG